MSQCGVCKEIVTDFDEGLECDGGLHEMVPLYLCLNDMRSIHHVLRRQFQG